MKKFLVISVLAMILSLVMVSNVFAKTNSLTILDVSDEDKSYPFNNDKGLITQKIVDIDNDNHEITVETTVKNTDEEKKENEVIFVIDGSLSTAYTSNHEDLYYDRYLELSKNLAKAYREKDENVKVGAVFAYGRKYDFDYDKMQNCDTPEPEFYDVNIVPEYTTPVEIEPRVATAPTNNIDSFNEAIDSMKNVPTELGFSWQTKVLTNLQAGIQKAEQSFSNNAKNKTIIIISDGIITEDADDNYFGPAEYPFYNYYNSDLWEEKDIIESETQIVYSNQITYGDIDYIQSLIYNNTIKEINSLEDKGINVENIVCGYENDEDVFEDEYDDWDDWEDTAPLYTYSNLLDFSNVESYDFNKYENMQSIIDSVIDNYNSSSTDTNTRKLDLTITLSEELLANYELIEVGTPTLGTAASNENKDSVIWNIEDLPNDEVKSLIFKLKLKDDHNKETAKEITRISKKITAVLDYNVDEIVPNPAIRIEEVPEETPVEETEKKEESPKASNPKTGDVIKKDISILAIGLGIFAFSTIVIKYGTKKKNVIF